MENEWEWWSATPFFCFRASMSHKPLNAMNGKKPPWCLDDGENPQKNQEAGLQFPKDGV